MTLNTFHFAGRGEMNVTLGIPRLREILMTASPNISTPSMDIPFRQDLNVDNLEKKAEKLKIELTCCSLSDILEYVDVTNRYVINDRKCACTYDIKFKFLKQKYFKKKYCVTPAKILEYFESTFVKNFLRSMKRKLDSQNMFKILVDVTSQKRDKNKDDEETVEDSVKLTNKINEDDESSSEEEGDGDADDARQKGTHDQELTYEEPEDEELIKSESEDELDEEATSMQKKENKENESDNEQPEEQEEQQDDEIGEPKLKKIRKRVDSNVRLDRIGAVKSISPVIDDYDFDDVREEWCTLSLNFRLNDFKIDLATLIQDEASKAVLHKIGKIDKAFLVKNSNAKEGEYENMIKTEGVSFLSLIQFSNLLNLNRVYSNDIHAIANTFGIEAGRQAIVQEMKNVFGVYGIEIDPRHLSLIADYMTFSGVIKGMNRFAINANSSPIQQITFETSTQFLKNATFIGVKDELNSPSARLFIGRPISAGSGILDCMLDKKQIQNCIKQVDESVLVTPKKSRKRKFLNIKSSQKKVKLDL